jgi:hypothetical protein
MKRTSQPAPAEPKTLEPFWWRDHADMNADGPRERARNHSILCAALADMAGAKAQRATKPN